MITYTLRERVVSDDELLIPDENKVFKGGYIAIVKYNTYLNAWCDKEHIKRFRSHKALNNFLKKNYTQEELEELGF